MNFFKVIVLMFIYTNIDAQQIELSGQDDSFFNRGISVDIDGDVAIVTASKDAFGDDGYVDVYHLVGGNWVFQQSLVPDDAATDDQLGFEALIHQNRIFITAHMHDAVVGGIEYENSGAVYVFEKMDGVWQKTAKLVANQIIDNGHFGSRLAAGVDKLFVTSSGTETVANKAYGTVHEFNLIASEWVEVAQIENDILYRGTNEFGSWGLSYDSDRLAITVANIHELFRSGVVHFYEKIEGEWVLKNTLKSPLDPADDAFGGTVSLSGDLILIGNNGEKSGTGNFRNGAAYLYEYNNDQWVMNQRFVAPNPDDFATFGGNLLLGDNQLFIAAIHGRNEMGTYSGEGQLFIYNQIDGIWSLSETVTAAGDNGHNDFGWSFDVDYDRMVIGAPGTNNNSGAAYISHIQPNSDRFVVNEGLNGNWYNPATEGQGIFLDVKPELDYAYAGWFTYDTELSMDDTEIGVGIVGQRWLVGNGQINQSTQSISFDLFYAAGGLFDDPAAVTVPENPYGSMTMEFAGCTAVTVNYQIFAPALSGTFEMTRPSAGSVGLCDQFNQGLQTDEGTFDVSLNGHWYNPNTLGQGLFVEQFPGTDQAFMGWFTHNITPSDEPIDSVIGAHSQRWLVGSGQVDADNRNVIEYDLLYSGGGLFDDPQAVTVYGQDGYGTLRIEFLDCANARVDYELTAVGLSGAYDVIKLFTDASEECPDAE